MALLKLNGLGKSYGDVRAVDDIHLSLKKNHILCLLGPSGCGKTTLLRLVAGLEQPDHGRIVFNGQDITQMPSHKRQFGFMFQDFALFPHQNVFENVAFGLQMQNKRMIDITRQTNAMLEMVGLTDMSKRNVAELSGGEAQRVALARSLAPYPRLLMLDEPLGSLDRNLRERLLPEIRAILKKLSMTAILVTHDQSEAFALGDEIVIMNNGRFEQTGPPELLYMRPKSLFVARFLGFHNVLPGLVRKDGIVQTDLGIFRVPMAYELTGKSVFLVIRPECARVKTADTVANHSEFRIKGRIVNKIFIGPAFRATIAPETGPELVFDLPNTPFSQSIGDHIELLIQPSGITIIEQGD